MSRNDAQDFTQRLYARIPENYRVYDQEQGLPLLALIQVIAEQVANLRQNLDDLWDDLFIETCQDWVVPYIGGLLGTNLLANPVGRSNRLEVRDTVVWRRSKGTVAMLDAVATEISGWSADIAEFFRSLGWSQNLNHLRLDRPLTADLRDSYRLSLLGSAGDPFAHAADFKPANDLDEARTTLRSPVGGRGGWGTPGRYQIKNLGFYVRRLGAFPVYGATPAAVDPGAAVPSGAAYFTFDPLHREVPLFTEATAAPLTRSAFNYAPWQFFGTDITVRQLGIPLAAISQPQPNLSSSNSPFTFGGSVGQLALNAQSGMRLLSARDFQLGSVHFIITAVWQGAGASRTSLGSLSTLFAARGDPQAFLRGAAATGAGHLSVTVVTGHSGLGWSMPASPSGRFPGAIIAIRAARAAAPHVSDARYVYLPPAFVPTAGTLTYQVADDGSTYNDASFSPQSLARASEGQIYPPMIPQASDVPASTIRLISRMPGALQLADNSRVAGAGLLIQAELFTGIFQPQGAIATVGQPSATYSQILQVPAGTWPAFTFAPARNAPPGNVPAAPLSILLQPLPPGNFVPSFELIVRGLSGESVLVYIPEIAQCPPTGVRLFVAQDGTTWMIPVNPQVGGALDSGGLARAATGQSLPIPGNWPLQYRRPVALDLCRAERSALIHPGELGIDPELGRFALATGDPAIARGGFSVDYVEGFSDRVGALTYDRMLDPAQPATRLVSRFGEAAESQAGSPPTSLPVHPSVTAALAAAVDGDIIEILDSATYSALAANTLGNSRVRNLTIRAATGQRPCLTFYQAANTPASASFRVTVAMDSLELNGLLISGGPLLLQNKISNLRLEACTLDPRFGTSLLAADFNLNDRASYLLCRCLAGGLRVGAGIANLTVADSVIDQSGSFAISGLLGVGSPPVFVPPPVLTSPPSSPPQTAPPAPGVQLERVTVLGRIHCVVLSASESILDDIAVAEDRQSGCIRFSRYETGSLLPQRYQCVPSEQDASSCPSSGRCLAPVFNSRRFGRPDYVQLAISTPTQILSGSEQHSEIGAFAGALNTIRLANLRAKLQEFAPVGLESVIIADT